jgi:hypothetical protein
MPYPDSEYPSILRGKYKRESQRLLAAAPELLYQLKQAVSLIAEKDLFDWEDASSGNSFQDMENAIRQAEGRE